MLEKLWSEIVRGLVNGHMSTNGRLDFRDVCELVDGIEYSSDLT
jgi:hypothetical protein